MKHAGLASLLVVTCVLSCAHTVPQDAATGHDGHIKGATPIALDQGEGIAHGIVTYPGGDRVDWKSIELPAGKHGTLDLKMTWTTPRPGLRIAFDVFDQWSTPIAVERAVRHRGHSRSTRIDHARGTYFVRVFAPRRGDAGAYKLVASFAEDPPPIRVSADVPEPPRLPAVPRVRRPQQGVLDRVPRRGAAALAGLHGGVPHRRRQQPGLPEIDGVPDAGRPPRPRVHGEHHEVLPGLRRSVEPRSG
jgi:hypothetical protein